jgi:uncharacterized protein involved in response to NO
MASSSSGATPNAPSARALFALGFRPFYLLAAILAVAGVAVWMARYAGWQISEGVVAGIAWHSHEMVFGVGVAVVSGFLFTAGRNWTGLPTPTGGYLAALAALWIAGRVLLVTGPHALAAVVDVAFLVAVAIALWIPFQRARNRNRFFVGLLLVLAALNAAFHLAYAGLIDWSPLAPVRAGLFMIVLIVTIMGGRVIPMFTTNGVRGARVRQNAKLDRAAIAAAALAFIALVAAPGHVATGVLCLAAAGLHGARLFLWDPWCTRRAPIVWILHLSYAWIPVGLLMHGLAGLGVNVPGVLADHALAVGAVGGVVMGMITRTARGHTGLPLQVGSWEVAAYVLVHAAAAIRVFVPLAIPDAYVAVVVVSGTLWCLAFAAYLRVFVPILSRPRADGREG